MDEVRTVVTWERTGSKKGTPSDIREVKYEVVGCRIRKNKEGEDGYGKEEQGILVTEVQIFGRTFYEWV